MRRLVCAAAVISAAGCATDPAAEAVAWARSVRRPVQDGATVAEQRACRKNADAMLCAQFNAAEEARVPYGGLMVYPARWPDVCAVRDMRPAR